MYGRGRGRSRGAFTVSSTTATAVNEEGKLLADLVTGPPPNFPELDRLPVLPEINSTTTGLLARWHKLRHAYHSGPYFVKDDAQKVSKVDPFAVKRYSDKQVEERQRPPLAAVVTLSSQFFPDELSSQKQKRASSKFAESSKALEVFWIDQLKRDKEIDRFDELAKKTEDKGESDNEANDLTQEQGEDEYSGDDYQQGEYFDDDEEYEDYDDAGDDGPVY